MMGRSELEPGSSNDSGGLSLLSYLQASRAGKIGSVLSCVKRRKDTGRQRSGNGEQVLTCGSEAKFILYG